MKYIIENVTEELVDQLDEDRIEYEVDPITGYITVDCDHIYYDHLVNIFDLEEVEF